MYLWIVITGGAFSFFAAGGIGSNDAANAFATSVGSKALTLKQAVVLAAIFETAGAVLMGNHVTDTIRKGIADYKCFEGDADLLMYGCMWVILSVGLWLFLASYLEMPVSTTHSCVGGMIGMAMVLKGSDCVIWYKPVETFPYVGGVGGIVMSWFLSPLFSAIIASFIFLLTRNLVLRKDYDSNRINIAYPILIGSTMTINTFFIIYKGAKGLGLDNTPLGVAFAVAFGIGGASALITLPLVPKLKKYVNDKLSNNNSIELEDIETTVKTNQLEYNIKSEKELDIVVNLHNNAEKFDNRTEEVFKYLQIFTAICDSFSHGANDVANAIGPFAAIWIIYQSDGSLDKKLDMGSDSYWILGLGGVGIALGLYVYGKKITYAIGEKLVKITPSRGVAIELSSALVIITGSRLKIPLSTTHCQVGATVGVGLLENSKDCSGINCRVFAKTALGWVITCVIVGLTSALLISQGAYGPSVFNEACSNSSRLM
tara:strand:+ start:893 stop:2350 length:1458 start_codon:yes stop_codon:yes gene_type:complete